MPAHCLALYGGQTDPNSKAQSEALMGALTKAGAQARLRRSPPPIMAENRGSWHEAGKAPDQAVDAFLGRRVFG